MKRLLAGGVAVAALALTGALAQDGAERPTYTFQNEPVNARALASLSDFKGRPVLVEFWGTR